MRGGRAVRVFDGVWLWRIFAEDGTWKRERIGGAGLEKARWVAEAVLTSSTFFFLLSFLCGGVDRGVGKRTGEREGVFVVADGGMCCFLSSTVEDGGGGVVITAVC
ncbi:hypothetical protein TcG_05075 [Trypanosoma cruzi]|nr:hypothetical protein TcG_05075 [Trypanosoma cruzi]